VPIQKLVGLAQKFGPAQNILEPVEGQGIKFFKKICWSLVIEKNAEGRRLRICKFIEITRTMFSNSERSEQFLVTECFFNLFLEVSHI
jgi:hypothetical protein